MFFKTSLNMSLKNSPIKDILCEKKSPKLHTKVELAIQQEVIIWSNYLSVQIEVHKM